MYAPALKKLYYALRGKGAYLEDGLMKSIQEIHVSKKKEDLIALLSRSHSMTKELQFLQEFHEVIAESIEVGSSLKGCLIAEGKADVYYRFEPIWQWDTAAMQCIVEEAGGVMEYVDGSKIRYNLESVKHPQGFYMLNNRANLWL